VLRDWGVVGTTLRIVEPGKNPILEPGNNTVYNCRLREESACLNKRLPAFGCVPILKIPDDESLPKAVLYTHAPMVKSSVGERAKAEEEGTVSQGPLAVEGAVRSR